MPAEESLKELCFTEMELVERVLLTVSIKIFMDLEGVCWPVSQINDRVWINVLGEEIVHIGMSKCCRNGASDLRSRDPP